MARGAVFVGDLARHGPRRRTRDGSALWTFKTGGEIKSSPVVVERSVLIGSYDTHLYALDAGTGKLRWKLQTDGPVHATPAVQDGIVYIAGCDERFRAVALADGKVLFRSPPAPTPARRRSIERRARVRRHVQQRRARGRPRGAEDRVALPRIPSGSFRTTRRRRLPTAGVIVGGRDKCVHAIDAATGKPAWKFATRARVDSSPAVAGGRVYVGSSDGKLYVLDAASGQKRWEFDAGAALTASPAIAAGRVVIGSTDGVLYCFG